MTATIIYPLHPEHSAFRANRHIYRTATLRYLRLLRIIAKGSDLRGRRDFGLSMRRRSLAGEIWAVRQALREIG